MPAKLLYRDAAGRDASVDIPNEGAFLGRATDCAVRTDDAMVSRKNCKIYASGAQWIVEDLGSSNGTFVNEVRVQKQALNHADVVRCGSLQVRFVEVAAPTTQPLQQIPATRPKTVGMQSPVGSVQVDPSLHSGGGIDAQQLIATKDAELEALAARLREALSEREAATRREEMATAELQRLRVETAQGRDRLAQLQRDKSQQDDEIHALTKVGNELREELEQVKGDQLTARTRVEELSEEVQARDRQLERARDDVQRAKQATDELRAKLAELTKTKDEGWKELNARIAELDQLREVIREQERILEERKVGLSALDAAVKEGRVEKERLLKEQAQVKSERDQLRDEVTRQHHKVEALEEEQRRLARLISEGGAGDASSNEEHVRLATELRHITVEHKREESERARLAERLSEVEQERAELQEQLAKVDVERAAALQQKSTLEAARARAEEKLAKAEAARAKAEEELGAAQKAHGSAATSADRMLVEIDRERKRAAELEEQLTAAKTRATELEQELQRTREAMESAPAALLAEATNPQLLGQTGEMTVPPDARIEGLQEELAELRRQLDAARATPVAQANGEGNGAHADVDAIKRKAEEAYTSINDALSELRTNILLAKELVREHGRALPDGEVARTLEDAIAVSVDRMEDAKGMLRQLREVVEL